MNSSEIDHSRYDIAISGGSFIGLTLAIALSDLSQNGLRIAVVDPQQIPMLSDKSDGRAFALSAGSKNMLDVLGIWSQVHQHAEPVGEIEITDTALEAAIRPVLLHFDNKSEGDPATYILESHYLLNALKERVRDFDNVSLYSGKVITRFDVDRSYIFPVLDDGTTLKAKLLVAADGKRSVLRKLAGIKTIGWDYDQMGIVTTIHHSRPHQGVAAQHFLPHGPFAILPLPGNRSSLVWSEKTNVAKKMLGCDDQEFLEEVRLRVRGRLGEVTHCEGRGGFPLNLQIAREFVADRFALVGDAAHGIHPIAGLGLNIGFRDVAALAEVVMRACRVGVDIGNQQILQDYSRWRRFDSTVSAFAMDVLNRLFSNSVVPIKITRDFGLGVVNRFDYLKDYFVSEAAGLSGDVPKLLQGVK